MNSQTPKSPVLYIVALLAMAALTSLACTFNDAHVNTSLPLIDVTINQAELDWLSRKGDFRTNGIYDRLLDEITRVELHDGFIRYKGTKYQSGWSKVKGSFDLSLTAENDVLKARIDAVNIPGMDLEDHRVVEENQEMEYVLTHLMPNLPGEVLFKEVVVKEGEMSLKIYVNADNFLPSMIRIEID